MKLTARNLKLNLKILLLISIVAIVLLITFILYSSNKYVIASKKYKITIDDSVKITYFVNHTGKDNYCYTGIKIDDNKYKQLLSEMQEAGYIRNSFDEHEIPLQNYSDWIPADKITQVCTLYTSKYVF